jgi:hypothetical protein
MTPVMIPEPHDEAAVQQEPTQSHDDNHELAHHFEQINPEHNVHEQQLMELEPQGSATTSDEQQKHPNQEPDGSVTTSDEVVQGQGSQDGSVTITVTMSNTHGQVCGHHWGTCDHNCDTQKQAGAVAADSNSCGTHWSACNAWCTNHDDSEVAAESLLHPQLQAVKTYWSCNKETATHMYKKQLTEAHRCIDKLRLELRATHGNSLALRDSVYILENIVTDSTSDHIPF